MNQSKCVPFPVVRIQLVGTSVNHLSQYYLKQLVKYILYLIIYLYMSYIYIFLNRNLSLTNE